MSSAFLSGLILACSVSAISAQQPTAWIPGPAPSVLFDPHTEIRAEPTPLDTTARSVRPTHWKRGLLIGGLIGTVGLGAFVYAFCEGLKETDESCLGPALGGAAVGGLAGGTVGALIGGQFPKHTDSVPAPDSTAASQ
jgi:hypothetical protein